VESPNHRVEVSVLNGGFANSIRIPPPVFRKFEHELQYGGSSGDSGGFYLFL
jgi:hypothetical protein